MENKDLVSIIMPSYNTAAFIAKSIECVLVQTYDNWELIIVDDCSTDDTDMVVAVYTDSRIRYLKNEKNSGAAVSRNRALQEARGRWIAFLDSDDLWLPEKLEKQVRFMEETGCWFSYTSYTQIDENGRDMGINISGPKVITKTGMYRYCWPGCLTVMYDADSVGLVQIRDIKKNNDYAMWLQVICKANCYLLDEPLAQYRRRGGSISNHGYTKLIKWHYRLFRQAENKGAMLSAIMTVRNLFWGVWKKIKYVKAS